MCKASRHGNITPFYGNECRNFDVHGNLIAYAEKRDSLCHLKCTGAHYVRKINAVSNKVKPNKII